MKLAKDGKMTLIEQRNVTLLNERGFLGSHCAKQRHEQNGFSLWLLKIVDKINCNHRALL